MVTNRAAIRGSRLEFFNFLLQIKKEEAHGLF